MRTACEIFTYNLNFYFAQSGKRQKSFAEFVGVSDGVVTNWLQGQKMPRLTKLDRICQFLSVTSADLFTDPEKSSVTTPYRERKMCDLYQHLNDQGKRKAYGYVQDLADSPKYCNG